MGEAEVSNFVKQHPSLYSRRWKIYRDLGIDLKSSTRCDGKKRVQIINQKILQVFVGGCNKNTYFGISMMYLVGKESTCIH